ncbi:hypothetical protein CBR_g18607 [Chara braunii]|uniref:Uncharacterized protein n=1 Tax=Chara braunii TaxID=69332 RepID=A0A388JT93_CHABU|nr:hypothetical protein CBR_g18607 [Chara braunii]|eukprot:GBG61011.1 hypothetical protein CBR_g18607 [Chara braunii]
MGMFRQGRPQVPVSTDPALWWKHAISLVLQEFRTVSLGPGVHQSSHGRRWKLRSEYLQLYKDMRTARRDSLGCIDDEVMEGVEYESWRRRLSRGACGRSSREGIGNAVAFAGGMANGELGKEVQPAGLAWSDIFLGEDGGDDGVVSADGEVLPVEVRAPDCEGVNHGEEFLLVGGVIHLRGKELLACEGDGVFARWSLGVSGQVLDGGGLDGVTGEMLGQYGSDGEVVGVSGDIEMASGVGDLEDRGRGDGLLE